MLKTVTIIYGMNEGPAHAWRLRRSIRRRGLTLVNDPALADIIIGHSGGCFFLPDYPQARIVLIANISCGTLGKLPVRMAKKIWMDFEECLRCSQIKAWVYKTFWNAVYGVTRIHHAIGMARKLPQYTCNLPKLPAKRVIVINNHYDPWARCIPAPAIQANPGYEFITLPGSHDDLWIHPDKYLDIVQS